MISEEMYNRILEGEPLVIEPDGEMKSWGEFSRVSDNINVIPGSFNPLHAGHLRLWECAKDFRIFEISITRVNKPNYSLEDLNKILKQFEWKYSVLITNTALFNDKNTLLWTHFYNEGMFESRIITYHIGYDTYERIKNTTPEVFQLSTCRFTIYSRYRDGKIEKFDKDAQSKNCKDSWHIHDIKLLKLASSYMKRIV